MHVQNKKKIIISVITIVICSSQPRTGNNHKIFNNHVHKITTNISQPRTKTLIEHWYKFKYIKDKTINIAIS